MLPSPLAAEVQSASGPDWLCIDLQHGLIGEEEMRVMVQAVAIRGTPVVARVAWNEPGAIMRALDAGVDGVIVPMVNSPEEARRAAEATRFPPDGNRSWGPLRPALAEPDYSPARANRQVVCLVMVETVQAFEQLDAILEQPGVDGIFVGPRDLSISLGGAPSGLDGSHELREIADRVARACAQRGLVAAAFCGVAQEARRWRDLGYSLLALQPDATLLAAGLAHELALARETTSTT
ncbi:MAG TPA: aldolase/citrate lyase family protein [Thermoleophilaceae bacterium]|jgi:4-hydroxy-2-oxoheptanedioate aldolase